MLGLLVTVILLVSQAASEHPADQRCLASEFGAVPSHTRYATQALQAAIDACSSRCGTVVLDGGSGAAYLSASLNLTGCVHLHVPEGVTLLAGDRVRRAGGAGGATGGKQAGRSSGEACAGPPR